MASVPSSRKRWLRRLIYCRLLRIHLLSLQDGTPHSASPSNIITWDGPQDGSSLRSEKFAIRDSRVAMCDFHMIPQFSTRSSGSRSLRCGNGFGQSVSSRSDVDQLHSYSVGTSNRRHWSTLVFSLLDPFICISDTSFGYCCTACIDSCNYFSSFARLVLISGRVEQCIPCLGQVLNTPNLDRWALGCHRLTEDYKNKLTPTLPSSVQGDSKGTLGIPVGQRSRFNQDYKSELSIDEASGRVIIWVGNDSGGRCTPGSAWFDRFEYSYRLGYRPPSRVNARPIICIWVQKRLYNFTTKAWISSFDECDHSTGTMSYV